MLERPEHLKKNKNNNASLVNESQDVSLHDVFFVLLLVSVKWKKKVVLESQVVTVAALSLISNEK